MLSNHGARRTNQDGIGHAEALAHPWLSSLMKEINEGGTSGTALREFSHLLR
jgi:hypothetical protein